MRALNERIVALLIVACAAGCAGGAGVNTAADVDWPGQIAGAAAPADAYADSAGTAGLELMFGELHAYLVGELGAPRRPEKVDALLAEVRSIIEAAEEFYLEGETLTAIRLLTEAEVLLRTNP